MADDDDFDAMLDGCLEDLNDQTAKHQAEDEERAQQLLAEQSQVGDAAEPSLQNFQAMLMQLTALMQNPDSSDGIANLQRTLAATIGNLEADPSATAEERAELERCAALVKNLDKPQQPGEAEQQMSPEDVNRIQELIANMMQSMPTPGAQTAAPTAASPDQDMQLLLQMIEEMQKAAPPDVPFDPSQRDAAQAASSASGENASASEAEALAALVSVLNSDQMVSPFLEMAEKYPAFLTKHEATLPQEDFKRYRQQYECIREITGYFSDGKLLSDEDTDAEVRSAKLSRFTEAVERLQAFGAPPPELVNESA